MNKFLEKCLNKKTRNSYKDEFYKKFEISNDIIKITDLYNLKTELTKDIIRKIITDLYLWLKTIENFCMYSFVDINSIYYDNINKKFFLNNFDDLSFEKKGYGYSIQNTLNEFVTYKSILKHNYFFPCWSTKILYDIAIIFLDYEFYICFDFNVDADFFFTEKLPSWSISELEYIIFINKINLKSGWQKNSYDSIKNSINNIKLYNDNELDEITNKKVDVNDVNDVNDLLDNNSKKYNNNILKIIYDNFRSNNLIFKKNEKIFTCLESLTIDINQPIFKGYLIEYDEEKQEDYTDINKKEMVIKILINQDPFLIDKSISHYYTEEGFEFIDGTNIIRGYIMESLYPIKVDNNIKINKFINDITYILQRLHKQGYAHFDIKPDNIMMNSKNQFVLIDYDSIYKFSFGFPRQSFTPLFSIWNNDYRDIFECTPIMDHPIHDIIELTHSLHYLLFDKLWTKKTDIKIFNAMDYLCNLKLSSKDIDDFTYMKFSSFF
jgi:hypothetical protein